MPGARPYPAGLAAFLKSRPMTMVRKPNLHVVRIPALAPPAVDATAIIADASAGNAPAIMAVALDKAA